MEELLKKTLTVDEKVIWKGRTAPRKLAQAPDRPKQMRLWVVFAISMAITLFGLFPYLISIKRPWDALFITFVVVNAIPLAVALRPGMDQRDLEKRGVCVVTDRRVIGIVKDNVHSLPLLDLAWEVVDRDGEAGTIRLGASVTARKHDDRAEAVVGRTDDDTGAKGFTFYHIDKVDEVAALLPTPVVMQYK